MVPAIDGGCLRSATPSQLLFSDMIVVASSDLVISLSLPLTPDEIAVYTLLHDGQSDWDLVLGERSARAVLHINKAALAIDAAASGQGMAMAMAMANEVIVPDALKKGRLVRIVANCVKTDFAYYLVTPEDDACQ